VTVDYAELDKKRELAIALKRARTLQLRDCFDPFKPDSRPTKQQQAILMGMASVLYSWVLGGNQSGKSQLGGRIVSWFFQMTHPFIDIKTLWPGEPVVILVVGRLNNQVEELWDKKIKPFLSPSEWRENRQGGTLQYVVNPQNGNKIIFATHNNPVEAREKLQSYSAHLVWLDELTDHLGIIEELQRRVQAKRGRMLVTATPKIRAEAVKRFLETPTPYSQIYKISMLDNPIYDDRREEILSQIRSLPQSQQDTILYGEWYVGEQAVFSFDPQKHVENPPNYSALWPHVVSVDPAASGLMGLSLWAAPYENAPRWWCVGSEYVKGAAPSDLVDLVESRISHCPNVIQRISDIHETWFIKEANKRKLFYKGVEKKRDRKKELIAQVNQALANGRIRLSNSCPDLIAELAAAQWSETVEDKIVNASSYHLSDTLQYFVDLMPAFKGTDARNLTFDHQLYLANKQRQANAARKSTGKPAQKWRIVARKGKVWNS
jgi:hypothetical protein